MIALPWKLLIRPLCIIWKLTFWSAPKPIQSTWLGQVNFHLGVFLYFSKLFWYFSKLFWYFSKLVWYFSKLFCICYIFNVFSVHAFSWKSHFSRQIKSLSCVLSYFARNLHSKMNWMKYCNLTSILQLNTDGIQLNKLAKLRRHASRVHFAKILFW